MLTEKQALIRVEPTLPRSFIVARGLRCGDLRGEAQYSDSIAAQYVLLDLLVPTQGRLDSAHVRGHAQPLVLVLSQGREEWVISAEHNSANCQQLANVTKGGKSAYRSAPEASIAAFRPTSA